MKNTIKIKKIVNKLHIYVFQDNELVEEYQEESDKQRLEGNIYLGKVTDVIKGMQAAFVDIGIEKNSFIHVKDLIPQVDEKKEKIKEPEIRAITQVGQKILVQVQKDSNDKKGARTSTHIKIPGKYVILMPNTNIITTSQKIQDEREKERLISIAKKKLPKNTGIIIRTAGAKRKESEIIKDIELLTKKWEQIKKEFEECGKKPQQLYKSPSIVEKLILDMPENSIQTIKVNDKKEYKKIEKIIKEQQEENIKIELYENIDLLEKYDLKKQIEKSKQRKIWLNCVGFITIDSTEALVAIDVNSGKYTGKSTLEETIYKVNYEATIEIVKQLRLRDIGGIIIIDYIDMQKQENKNKIEELLKKELKQDRAKTQVEGFTKLNLMEMTRKHICSHNS